LLLLEFGKINPPQSISAKHQVENCLSRFSKALMKKKAWRSKANVLNAESINPQSIGTRAHPRRRSLATTTHLLHLLLVLPLVFGNCGGVDCQRGREKVMTLSWALYLR